VNNLSLVAKRMKLTNKVPHTDLARGDRKEKTPFAVAKIPEFSKMV
jgi:hypothetical protein